MPEPVRPRPRMSLPASASGMVAAWIGKGWSRRSARACARRPRADRGRRTWAREPPREPRRPPGTRWSRRRLRPRRPPARPLRLRRFRARRRGQYWSWTCECETFRSLSSARARQLRESRFAIRPPQCGPPRQGRERATRRALRWRRANGIKRSTTIRTLHPRRQTGSTRPAQPQLSGPWIARPPGRPAEPHPVRPDHPVHPDLRRRPGRRCRLPLLQLGPGRFVRRRGRLGHRRVRRRGGGRLLGRRRLRLGRPGGLRGRRPGGLGSVVPAVRRRGPRRMRGGRRRGGRVLALAALAALPLAVAPGPVPARALLPLAMPVVRGRRAVPGVPPETAGPPSGTSPPRSPADWDGLARPPDPSSPTLMQPAAATTARAVAAIRTGTYKGRTGGHLRGSRSRRAQLPSPTRGHASGEADLTRARHPYPRECSRASSIPKWWAIS